MEGMEGKEKTFGELKRGDTIYFFFKDYSKGPHEIREYVLENEPLRSNWDSSKIINIDINLTGDYLYDALEFSTDGVEETLNLADFNYNCLLYGDEYWYFTTSKEIAISERERLILSMLETKKKEIDILNEKLNKHISEYGTSKH